jgi:hypothetical protein
MMVGGAMVVRGLCAAGARLVRQRGQFARALAHTFRGCARL